jgi:predicted dehydrogenase
MNPHDKPDGASRRDFLKSSTVLAAGAAAAELTVANNVHAAGDDLLKVGLIGCGGRGTGAAAQALNADRNVKLVAMGDAFEDRLQSSLATLRRDREIAPKIDVKDDHCFTGFDAYKQVIDSGVDVVLLCAPPHFRPAHFRYAVEKNKHVFAEKPVAVDAPGVRSVLDTCEMARRKNLSVVSGLCLRFDPGFRETVQRIHDGAIGDIVALQANDLRSGIWERKREENWTDMVFQMRNWYHFTWLSGDFNVEQHVHYLDVCAWLMKNEYPTQVVGMGGRQVRSAQGHIYDHFAVVYEYARGQKLYSVCRQQPRCKNDMSCQAMGTRGTAQVSESQLSITTGGNKWQFRGKHKSMYQIEHDELFASIRASRPINNGEYMTRSTLMAIMARMSAYTGQLITWDMALKSVEDLSPPRYDWNVALPMPPVAMPGQTRFS